MDTELSYRECLEVLLEERVGRVAFCTPVGPEIVPLNYRVVEEAIVFRTSPYSLLGTHGREARMAFEVDRSDPNTRSGSSVVAHGRCVAVEESGEQQLVRIFHDPDPWAAGARWLYLKLPWTSLTGRWIGAGATRSWPVDFEG